MDATTCPNAFEMFYAASCGDAASTAATQAAAAAPPAVVTWHMVPLSPSATGLVLVLLLVLFTTLLVSKTEK